jgi:hypothetical protein
VSSRRWEVRVWEAIQALAEKEYKEKSKVERRHGYTYQRDSRGGIIENRPAPGGGEHPERDGDAQGNEARKYGQFKGVPDFFTYHLGHGPAELHGSPHVAF